MEQEKKSISPEATKQIDKMKKQIPERDKWLRDYRRLIDLAKNSLHAGVNADFLELQENRYEREKNEFELVTLIVGVVEKERPLS